MVEVESEVVKSSLAAPWLADELLDEIAVHPEVERASSGNRRLAERLSGPIALGMFIAASPEKRLSISRDGLFDPASNPGWAMVLATLRASDGQYDGPPDPAASDRDYRFLIAQSQVHRQLARRSAEEAQPRPPDPLSRSSLPVVPAHSLHAQARPGDANGGRERRRQPWSARNVEAPDGARTRICGLEGHCSFRPKSIAGCQNREAAVWQSTAEGIVQNALAAWLRYPCLSPIERRPFSS